MCNADFNRDLCNMYWIQSWNHGRFIKIMKESLLLDIWDWLGGIMVSTLVTHGWEVWDWDLTWAHYMLCSCERNLYLIIPLKSLSQLRTYKWVLENCYGCLVKCWRVKLQWTNIPSRGRGEGESSNNPSRFMLRKSG